jgi:hypothetical protein
MLCFYVLGLALSMHVGSSGAKIERCLACTTIFDNDQDFRDVFTPVVKKYSRVVVTFSEASYIPVLCNWLSFAAKRNDVVVIALDAIVYEYVREKSLLTFFPHWKTRVGSLVKDWTLRLNFLMCLLQQYPGVLTIMSNVDALWVRDPVPMLLNSEHDDIVMSSGTYPADLAKSWHGKTGCMGFAGFRSSLAMRETFLPLLVHMIERNESRDDQVLVNMALKKLKINWRVNRGKLGGDLGEIQPSLHVQLLPYSFIVRHCTKGNASQHPFILHCLSLKTADRKESWMKSAGLWNPTC